VNPSEAWQDVLDNEGLVKWNVDKFVARHRSREFDDFLTAGYIGCYRAAMNYEPERGTTKGTYYSACICNELRREAELLGGGRLHGHAKRRVQEILSLHGELEPIVTSNELLFPGIPGLEQKLREKAEDECFEDALAVELDHRAVREAVNQLDEDQREAIFEHFWNNKTYRQMGRETGKSHTYPYLLVENAKKQLRRELEPVLA